MVNANYDFKDQRLRDEFEYLNQLAPIEFAVNRDGDCLASMEFDEDRGCFTVVYNDDSTNKTQHILHELLHVRQCVVDGFRKLISKNRMFEGKMNMLGWFVDDTDVWRRMWHRYNIAPICEAFFEVCRRDCKAGTITAEEAQGGDKDKVLARAWRLRIADLCLDEFRGSLDASQRAACVNFTNQFAGKNDKADAIVAFVRESHRSRDLSAADDHAAAQVELRGFLRQHLRCFPDEAIVFSQYIKQDGRWRMVRA